MNIKNNKFKLLTMALLAISYQSTAVAKTASRVLIEEVQVFGTKQSTSQAAQDVPLQISAFDDEKLDALQSILQLDFLLTASIWVLTSVVLLTHLIWRVWRCCVGLRAFFLGVM